MNISVFHTPDELPTGSLPDCAVAIDVLRATSTMAAAFQAGAEAIEVFSDIDQLMAASERWPAAGRVRLGEREGTRVPGCDLGNSPLEATPRRLKGRRVFMSTTNGTRCLDAIRSVPAALTAALTTRHAVAGYLATHGFDSVWLVASGWRGGYSLEDTVCAGAIMARLAADAGCTVEDLAGNDAAIAAAALHHTWKNRLRDLLSLAHHGRRLLRLGCARDLDYCAQLDLLDIVPVQTEPGVLTR